MIAVTGLIQEDWSLQEVVSAGEEVTVFKLYNDRLDLMYIIEHHVRQETFEASPLREFIRGKYNNRTFYDREKPFEYAAQSTLVNPQE